MIQIIFTDSSFYCVFREIITARSLVRMLCPLILSCLIVSFSIDGLYQKILYMILLYGTLFSLVAYYCEKHDNFIVC